MWALVTKNGAAKPLSHRFAALWEPIWGLCGFIGQFLEEVFSETCSFRRVSANLEYPLLTASPLIATISTREEGVIPSARRKP